MTTNIKIFGDKANSLQNGQLLQVEKKSVDGHTVCHLVSVEELCVQDQLKIISHSLFNLTCYYNDACTSRDLKFIQDVQDLQHDIKNRVKKMEKKK